MGSTVKNTIYQHRININLTQEELGKKTGVTRQTIIAIEKGNYTPSVELALKLAKTFNTRVEALFSL
jgi:putative transcriptional regulator